MDFDIKIKNQQFHFGVFDKRDLFHFSIVRIPVKINNVPSSIVYSAIGVESLRIANVESFSAAIKPFIACMIRQGVSIEKINIVIVKYFNKHQGDFSSVCKSKQELLILVS